MTISTRTETIRKALPGHQGQTSGLRGVGQSIWEESLTPRHKVGTRLQLGCRVFYYAKAGEGLTAAKMTAFTADKDLEESVTVAHGIGTTELTITAASAITKDQYAEGMLIVDQGTGAGDQYIIKSNAAIASGTGTVTIYEPGLVTAWSTSDTDVALWTNPFYGVTEVAAATASGAGIPLIDITGSTYYFWLQTYGPAGVLIKTANVSGTSAAEQAMHIDTAGDLTAAIAGDSVDAISILAADDAVEEDADYGCVYLTCVA